MYSCAGIITSVSMCRHHAHVGTLAMVPSHGYTGYDAFTWVHWLQCLHMGTLAMVPSHGYTGYGACTWVHWLPLACKQMYCNVYKRSGSYRGTHMHMYSTGSKNTLLRSDRKSPEPISTGTYHRRVILIALRVPCARVNFTVAR